MTTSITRRALSRFALAALAAAPPRRAAAEQCPRPPRMTLRAGGRRQRGRLGSYCWSEGESGCCVDMAGEPYPAAALPAALGEAPELDFSVLGPVAELSYTIRPAGSAGEDGTPPAGSPTPEPVRRAILEAPTSPLRLPADLPRGRHLIGVFVAVEGWGDTWQGFRLAVGEGPAATPAATPAAGATPAATPDQR